MKRIITISLAVMLIMTDLHSQVYHREYYSTPTTLNATSSAFVVSDVSNKGYLFKTDGSDLEVTVLDAYTMNPIGSTSLYLHPSQSMIMHLNNAFLDHNGDVVIYGYFEDGGSTHGMMMKYCPLSPSIIQIFFMPMGLGIDAPIISGCCGRDSTDKPNYIFVDKAGYIFATSINFAYVSYWGGGNALLPKNGKYTHVSYDETNKRIIASGLHTNNVESTIVSFIQRNLNPNTAHTYIYQWGNFNHALGRTLHQQIDNKWLFLCQDLSDVNSDYVWMSTVDMTSGNIRTVPQIQSEIVKFGFSSVKLIDIAYNSIEKRVMLLSHFDYCQSGDGDNIIFQENPFALKCQGHHLDAIHLTSLYDSYCNGLIFNDIFLQQIKYIKANNRFFAAGYNLSAPQHIYSIDLRNVNSARNCNERCETGIIEPIVSKQHEVLLANEHYHDKFLTMKIQSFSSPLVNTYCYNTDYIPDDSKVANDNNENKLIDSLTVDFQRNSFMCKNALGKCTYKLYDITGRVIQEGETYDKDVVKLTTIVKGVYILNVIDETNSTYTKKLFLN